MGEAAVVLPLGSGEQGRVGGQAGGCRSSTGHWALPRSVCQAQLYPPVSKTLCPLPRWADEGGEASLGCWPCLSPPVTQCPRGLVRS